jgi:hypothetical protein
MKPAGQPYCFDPISWTAAAIVASVKPSDDWAAAPSLWHTIYSMMMHPMSVLVGLQAPEIPID